MRRTCLYAETSNFVLRHSRVLSRPRCGSGQKQSGLNHLCFGHPSLAEAGTATQLIVDGKPFLALAGELSNNSATSLEYMKPVWPKLVEAKLNTVLAGVSWAQIEPQEGKFDFSVLDGVIRDARSHNLRLVLLWFASWKNGLSSYPPDWVKRDFERFPRAQIVGGTLARDIRQDSGRPRAQIAGSRSIELLSPFSDANRDADARAFAALMRHIKEVDGQQHTVIMIQVENEVGMQGDTRDRSPAANQAFAGPVPKELMDYLQQHKDTLIPELRQVWEAAGFKTSGTWEEVFGKGRPTDEIFMAWNFARYIGRVAEAGKAEYPMPMYVNCPQFGFGKAPAPVRGGQSGGPMPDAMDVWRAGAPRIDIFAPDIYGSDFVAMVRKVHPIREPAVHTRDERWAWKAQPERSTPSDAMMRSVSRLWGFDRSADSRQRSDQQLRPDRAIGAPDCGTPGQRHDVRRPAGPERPAAEDPGGELHAGGRVFGAPS